MCSHTLETKALAHRRSCFTMLKYFNIIIVLKSGYYKKGKLNNRLYLCLVSHQVYHILLHSGVFSTIGTLPG